MVLRLSIVPFVQNTQWREQSLSVVPKGSLTLAPLHHADDVFVASPVRFSSGIQQGRQQPINQLSSNRTEPVNTILTDIDGTWGYHNENDALVIPDSASTALKQFEVNGGLVVISTGRSHKAAKKIAQKQGLDLDKTWFIVEQGTRLVAPRGTTLLNTPIPNDDVVQLLNAAERIAPRAFVQVYANGKAYRTEDDRDNRYEENEPHELLDSFTTNGALCSQLTTGQPNKMVFDVETGQEEKTLLTELTSQFGENYHVKRTAPHFIEVYSKKASKGQAAIKLAKYLAGKNYADWLKSSATLGDASNDLELAHVMNQYDGVSIAMGNASDDLKTDSQYVTHDVMQDGYAAALAQIAIINQRAK